MVNFDAAILLLQSECIVAGAVARDHRDMFLNAHRRFFEKVCDPEPAEAMAASDMLYPVTLVLLLWWPS